jgi:hypothetical protein
MLALQLKKRLLDHEHALLLNAQEIVFANPERLTSDVIEIEPLGENEDEAEAGDHVDEEEQPVNDEESNGADNVDGEDVVERAKRPSLARTEEQELRSAQLQAYVDAGHGELSEMAARPDVLGWDRTLSE